MIMAKNNVQMLNVKSVHNTIQMFLKEKGDNNKNTRMAYEKDIANFFQLMIGKELSQITVDDLKFDKNDIMNYRSHLMELKKPDGTAKYKNSSINRFIDSVRSLFVELEGNGYDEYINSKAFRLKNLPERNTTKAGELTDDEFELMEETALTLENGLMKSLLIGLAGRTSIRLSALLSLTWSDITRIDDEMWLVHVIDKGNKEDDKPIMNSFYEKLLEIKVGGQDKIFNISDTAVNNMINRLCKLLEISEDRNITFHSLKGYGINVVIDNGGSAFDAKDQANHANMETTDKRYRKRTKDWSKYAGVIIDSKLDIGELDTLDKDQLLALIKATSSVTQRQIMKAYKRR